MGSEWEANLLERETKRKQRGAQIDRRIGLVWQFRMRLYGNLCILSDFTGLWLGAGGCSLPPEWSQNLHSE